MSSLSRRCRSRYPPHYLFRPLLPDIVYSSPPPASSCVKSEPKLAAKLKLTPSGYLKRLYYDALVYHKPSLACLIELVGVDRLMFGTDNPFFPPPSAIPEQQMWPSTAGNYDAMAWLPAQDRELILNGNAKKILGIK